MKFLYIFIGVFAVFSVLAEEVSVEALEQEKPLVFSVKERLINGEEASSEESEDVQLNPPSLQHFENLVRDRELDILIVLDNSKSMNPIINHQLAYRMKSFIDPFIHLSDLRLAVLAADVKRGPVKLINLEKEGQMLAHKNFMHSRLSGSFEKGEPLDRKVFIDTMVRQKEDGCSLPPFCGGMNERPLLALYNYLLLPSEESFIREDARTLAVVVFTDNKDGSDKNAQDIIDAFNSMYGDHKKLKIYTVTITSSLCQKEVVEAQGLYSEGQSAPRVTECAKKTGGESFDICLPSYEAVSQKIISDHIQHSLEVSSSSSF